MSKEVQMSIKMESDLRDQFMAVAGDRHRPAAQIIRELMRMYIAASEPSNALTADTIRKSGQGKDVLYGSNESDLSSQSGTSPRNVPLPGRAGDILALLASPRFANRPVASAEEVNQRISTLRDEWNDRP
jgi:predicted DNA-binding protein